MKKIIIFILLGVLIIGIVGFLLNIETKVEYTYGGLFIKREQIDNRWKMKNIVQYYDENGNLIKETDVIDYDLKDQFLSNYLVSTDSIYVYGDRGIYRISLDTQEVLQYSNKKYISHMYENESSDLFFVENTGYINDNEYINVIYKNQNKLIEISGTISDFIVINNTIYFKTLDIDKNVFTRYTLDVNSLEKEILNCDNEGVFVKVNEKAFIIDSINKLIYNPNNCLTIESDNFIDTINEYDSYYNNINKKTYYGLYEVLLVNENKLKFNNIEQKNGYTFLKEKGNYIPLTFADGKLFFNTKSQEINTNNKTYTLMTFFKK